MPAPVLYAVSHLAQVPGAKTASVHGLSALLVLQVGRWKHMRVYTHEARLYGHLPCLRRQAATPLGIVHSSIKREPSAQCASTKYEYAKYGMTTMHVICSMDTCYCTSTLTVGSRGSLPYSFTAFSIICSRTWGAVPACRQMGQRVIEQTEPPI